jgi:Ca2+-binding EF-hand superfamily protein
MSRSVIFAILVAAYLSTPLVRAAREVVAKDDLDVTDQVVEQSPDDSGTTVDQKPDEESKVATTTVEADAERSKGAAKKKADNPPGFFARMNKKLVGAFRSVKKKATGPCYLENKLFRELDTTVNGVIDEEEFMGADATPQLLAHIHATKATQLNKASLFKAWDVDADGYIDKEDFCHGVQRMQQFFLFDESEDEKLDIIEFNQGFALSEFFDGMDLDKSETLDVKELEMAKEDVQLKLQTITGVKGMRKVFKTLDTNGDGSVDKLEFIVSLRKALEARRAVRT